MIWLTPGVIQFIATASYDNLITKGSLLGTVMKLPPRLIERLNAFTQKELEDFMKHVLPQAYALCQDMFVLGTSILLPAEQYDELMMLLYKIGELKAVWAECEGSICEAEVGGCCEIFEERGHRHVELRTDCSRFDCRRICMLAVLL
jgi:hypothetical protein